MREMGEEGEEGGWLHPSFPASHQSLNTVRLDFLGSDACSGSYV